MTTRVLVLGATGYIGRRLLMLLGRSDWAHPVAASRSLGPGLLDGVEARHVDTLDAASLRNAVADVDAVVNCVAGSPAAIAEGARLLVDACLQSGAPRIVHMSSMAAYGSREGHVTESSPLDPTLGWYARAKCDAEAHFRRYAAEGRSALLLRPGCVYGSGCELWVGRIGRLLRNRRLGDLGTAGDGWSNLVHVDDVCAAVAAGLRLPIACRQMPIFNLSAPDSPRWNQYFLDLGVAIGATPVRRIRETQVQLDAWALGPLIKLCELVARRRGVPGRSVPVPVSRSLVKLWPQQILLDSSAALRELGPFTHSYQAGLAESVEWFCRAYPRDR